jgi:hypothetical protein
MGIMSRNGRFFLLLVMSSIVLLLGFSCWAVKHNRRTADSSFQLENMVLCDEVDEKMRPLHTGTQFMSGIRQLCLCFDYSLASKRSDIRIKWYYGDHLVYSEVLLLSPGKGSKVFCLLREDGSPLPVGAYDVRVCYEGTVYSSLNFEISSLVKVP